MTSLLGTGYESSSEDEVSAAVPRQIGPGTLIAAPDVSLEVWSLLRRDYSSCNADIL
jgi:hypothetical protein